MKGTGGHLGQEARGQNPSSRTIPAAAGPKAGTALSQAGGCAGRRGAPLGETPRTDRGPGSVLQLLCFL